VAEVWRELLGIEPIGVQDGFYELGGHSLLATQLARRLREAFPVELTLGELFEAENVAAQAELIEAKLVDKLAELSEDEVRLLL
jgi:acyl carrier protein